MCYLFKRQKLKRGQNNQPTPTQNTYQYCEKSLLQLKITQQHDDCNCNVHCQSPISSASTFIYSEEKDYYGV
ncbi:hypothetical protein RN001_016308 [Aquatica leii]|uniref:Uncharacterized protein n=1 Tax=Aquatica leii TaxID=1421715 RepID=A0AAN7NXR9_9COLE|nr:hypothetical protein RN001_016308 [Aquatica leii]